MSSPAAWRRVANVLALVCGLGLGAFAPAQPAAAAGAGPGADAAGGSLQVVATEHATVVFADPRLEPMARRAALIAEEAVRIVAGWFGSEPFAVTLTLDGSTDVFNAIAAPIPRPTVALRFVPPVESALGLGAEDWLELLVVHELAHLAHFTRTAAPGPGLGLVGEGVAPPPPLWLVEGLATWLESELTQGGRRDDALTAGVLATLALGDAWPTLAEAGTGTFEAWPGGRTRYLLGVSFLDALTREHGWSAVVAALERFNLAPAWSTFGDAWRATTGESLDEAWEAWRRQVARAAEERAAAVPPPPERWTDTGGTTGLPALSPAGDRLAWRVGPTGVAVAPLSTDDGANDDGGAGGEAARAEGRAASLGEPTVYLPDTRVESLDWLDDDTLIFARIVPTAATRFADVFVLDLATGLEERWTVDERAHFARGAGRTGCGSWVRVVPGRPAAIVERCRREGRATVLWEAPAGAEIVGFDRAPDGRAVASVWAGGEVGLVVLARADGGGEGSLGSVGAVDTPWTPTWLTWGRHHDLDPVWTPDGAIRFRSNRTERFEVWEVRPGDRTLTRWTDTLGGAFQPAAAHALVVLGAEGFDLAPVPAVPRERLGATPARAPFDPRAGDAHVEPAHAAEARGAGATDAAPEPPQAVPYDPWPSLAPFGWWPTRLELGAAPARLAAEAQVLGQDAAARHAWTVTFGLDTALAGPLGPAYASGRYTWNPTGAFALWAPPRPITAWVEAGAWPHVPHLAPVSEIALGARVGAVLRYRDPGRAAAARVELGVLRLPSRAAWEPDLRLDAAGTTAGADRWGYPGSGVRLGASVRWTPAPAGPSFGAWADARARAGLAGGSVAGSLRAGYRQAPPVPLILEPWALTAGIEGRWHLPVAWRYGDGRYALERVTSAPAVRAWWDGGGVGIGADVRVGADLLVSYGLPVTVFVHGGWSQRWWGTAGFGIPF